MKTALYDFFGRDDVLRGSIIALILYLAANMCFKLLMGAYSLIISDCILILCVLFLLTAFIHHNKNVQKGLLGAVLMWYLMDQLSYVSNTYIFTANGVDRSNTPVIFLETLTFILYTALFVNYFIIISDHHSKPVSVMINQILVLIIAVNSILQMIYKALCTETEAAVLGEIITWNIAVIGLLAMVVSYETHFDIFKQQRELEASENK